MFSRPSRFAANAAHDMPRFAMLRRAITAAVVAAIACAAGNDLHAQRPNLRDFDAYVAKGVRDWEIPGLAIAIVKDDSVVFARGYGVRALGKPDRVDEHTLFAIGSTTKAMTAASIGMLMDEGKVSLRDPVTRWLPALQLYDPAMTRELVVRDLLTHHTGLGGADLLWMGSDYSVQEVIRRMRWLKPAASFRSRYAYQNVQYAMAGEVIAAASGMPWSDFVRTRIFAPLGMRETVPTLAGTSGMPNVATPHLRIDDTVRVIENRPVDPVAAAGSVWSSVSDMAKWMRFVLDSARWEGKRLLSEKTYAEWLTPQVIVPQGSFYPTTRLTKPHMTAYALGWFLQDYQGEHVVMHTGSIDGMIAIIGLIPDRKLGVYVLANLDHAELRHALMFRAFDMYAGNTPRDWNSELLALYGGMTARGKAAEQAGLAKRATGTRPSLALDRYAGTYADSLLGTATVTVENGTLRARIGKGFDGMLEHWHYDTFRARWADKRLGSSLVTFVLDAQGSIVALRPEIGDDAEFGRVSARQAER